MRRARTVSISPTFHFACAACIAACSGRSVGASASFGAADGDDTYGGEIETTDASLSDDFGEPANPLPLSTPSSTVDAAALANANQGANADADVLDADPNADATAKDAGPDGSCASPLVPGDVAIDELMIESVAGTGDYGEWIEVRSNVDCMANLRGLHGECPRGAKVATFDVMEDTWVPARGSFVIADSGDPAVNHDLPGLLLLWFGQPGDVLRNKGSTITLSLDGVLLDTVTYPALALKVGSSWAFPSDCDPSSRSDFGRWKQSTASWFPAFLGTPNGPNVDVACDDPTADP
jgi:hypothetical protein